MYASPGSTCRYDDCVASTRLTASRIVPFASQRMTLLCFAMISTHSRSVTGSPISFVASKSRKTVRSSPDCVIALSFAPIRCLRSSMHSIGGFAGFSGAYAVRCNRGLFADADKKSLYAVR